MDPQQLAQLNSIIESLRQRFSNPFAAQPAAGMQQMGQMPSALGGAGLTQQGASPAVTTAPPTAAVPDPRLQALTTAAQAQRRRFGLPPMDLSGFTQ